MNVLVVNCGSSSLKFQLINSDTEAVAAKGLCERIGLDGRLVYQPAGGEKEITEAPMPTHTEAIRMVTAYCTVVLRSHSPLSSTMRLFPLSTSAATLDRCTIRRT